MKRILESLGVVTLLFALQPARSQTTDPGGRSAAEATVIPAPTDQMTAERHDAELAKLLESEGKAITAGPYQPTADSLNRHTTPEWYADAKLGIFIHWGLYSVPGYAGRGCWYGHDMYDPEALCAAMKKPRIKSGAFDFHRETYGPADQFGYKDFAPYFTASAFDADAWVSLFKEGGARFVVPVSAFSDGFAMWDSKLTDWNVVKVGPHRDYDGLLAAATRRQGLKFGVSWHCFYRPYWFRKGSHEANDMHPPYAGTPWSLYGPSTITPEFVQDCFGRLVELVDGYRPDLVWFDNDTGCVPEAELRRFAAFYFNRAEEWKQSVAINDKTSHFPPHSIVFDIERGKQSDLRPELWQCDTSVSWFDWSYIHEDSFKTVDQLVHELVDIVSKNGVLLLNIGPRGDGSIPPEPQALLRGVGAWLKTNGEAIYGTRPCQALGFGEGTHNSGGGTLSDKAVQYNCQDFRFTQKGAVVYAIAMDWPAVTDHFLIKSLPVKAVDGTIADVRLLGNAAPLEWKTTEQGLWIRKPARPPCDGAYAFAITVNGKLVGTPKKPDPAPQTHDDKTQNNNG